jgi:hypothetical protein
MGTTGLKDNKVTAVDIAIERQTLNDELTSNIPLEVFGKKKVLKEEKKKKTHR